MPTLSGLNGRSLNADLSGGLDLLLKTFGTGPEREAKKKAEALLEQQKGLVDIIAQPTGEEASPTQEAITGVAQAFPGGAAVPDAGKAGPTQQEKQQALVRLASINPQMAQQVRQTIQFGDKQQALQLAQEVDKGVRMGALIQGAKTFPEKRALLMKMAQAKAAKGEDTGRVLELRGMPEQVLDLEVKRMLAAGADTKTLLTPQPQVRQQVDAEGNPTGAQETVTTDFLGNETVTEVKTSAVPQQLVDLTDAEGNVIGQENEITGEKKFLTAAQRGQRGGTETPKEPVFLQVQVKGPDGKPVLDELGQPTTKQVQSLTSFDPQAPNGKKWTTVIQDFDGEIISKSTGVTNAQANAAAIKTAGLKTAAVQKELIKTAGQLEKVKKRSQNIETRLQSNIDEGIAAVKSLPNLKRTRELLNLVKTGGFAKMKNALDRFTGTENANEAELNNSLGKTVLSQLKATFGSAFTAQEGQLLQDIEANFGKSTAGNIRLLDRAIKATDIRARIGASAARTAGDENSINVFKEFRKFSLNPTTSKKGAAPGGGLKVGQTKKLGNITIRRKK